MQCIKDLIIYGLKGIYIRRSIPSTPVTRSIYLRVMVWPSGSGVGRINEVILRRARLVLRWVTVRDPPKPTQPHTSTGWKWAPDKRVGGRLNCVIPR